MTIKSFPIGAAIAAIAVLAAFHASAQTVAPNTGDGVLLSVTSQGQASQTPDIATLSAGVVTRAGDANTALRENNTQMTRLMTALRAAGVAERDVQTSGFSIHPQYRHSNDDAPVITGYQVGNNVTVKLRDTGRIGDVIGALVENGANNVHGPSFGIEAPEALYDEARKKALLQAQERAALYASSLGLNVRRTVSISEGGGFQQPMADMYVMRTQSASAPPISEGESSVSVSIDVVFELGQ